MLTRPRFKPFYRVEVVPPDTVYLLSEREHVALQGELYVQLAPLLGGELTTAEIVRRVGVPPLAVHTALQRLHGQGYLCEAVPALPEAQAAFWEMEGIRVDDPGANGGRRRVAVESLGSVAAGALEEALGALHVSVGAGAELSVVLVDDYLQAGLEARNRDALKHGRPWMLVKPVGAIVWIGPVFVPGTTGCWSCLAHRLRGNRPVEHMVQREKGLAQDVATSRASLPTTVACALQLAATHACGWLLRGGSSESLEGKLVTLDVAALAMQHHVLVRRPQCPACGAGAADATPRPLVLQSRGKRFTTDGGHRAFTPEQTLQRYGHHVSPITGVVESLVRLDAGSGLVNVFGGAHRFTDPGAGLPALRRNLAVQSAGKGKSEAQSRAGALCEAIERYSGLFTGDEPRVTATYRRLGEQAVHPARCLQVSERQYRDREAWNRAHSSFAWIPDRFDETREIEWTPLWSVSTGEVRYLLTAYCYYGYPLPADHQFCTGDSNGNAAGNNLEEAILQGYMEVVERDSVALWWYNRLRRPEVDLDSFDDPYLRALRAEYAERGREFWVLDVTSDLGIPSFAAISRQTGQPGEEIIQGYGSHFDPRVGLLRAVTEMNQMLALVSRQPLRFEDDPDHETWYRDATVQNQPYLLPDPGARPLCLHDYPRQWSDDLKDDVLRCAEVSARHGMEMLVLDQTRPDIGLSVVKVVVPGMRHFWPRFAPGRLYDVPVRLGWLAAPTPEEQLNPLPISS